MDIRLSMNKSIIGLVAALITTPVFADTGFYGELLLGNTNNESKSKSDDDSVQAELEDHIKLSGSSTSYALRGGYQFHDNFAIELSHHVYGDVTYKYTDRYDDTIKNKIDSNSNNIAIKGIWPVTDAISLNARLGAANWDFDVVATDSAYPDEVEKFSESGTDVYYGIGAEYILNDKVSLGIEYSTLSMKWGSGDIDVKHTVDSLSLVLQMKF